jgi:drug/metabolite transporter (DMT)-like permease
VTRSNVATTSAPPAASRSSFSPADAALLVLLASMWGMSFLFIKVAVGALSPLWVVAGRTTVGGLVLAVVLRARGARLPRDPRMWLHLLVLATLGNAIPWGFVAWAQQSIPSGIAAVLNTLVPASTLAVAVAVGLERLTLRRIAGLALAVAGTVVIVGGELQAPGRLGPLIILAAATVMYGGASVYAKRFVSARVRPLPAATGQVLLAAVLTIPTAWLVGPTPRWAALGPSVVVSVLLLGAFGTGTAFLVFYMLIERVGATNATMVTYLIPVVGLLAGAVVLGERFGPHVLVGGLVVGAGIWLAQRTSAVAATAVPEAPRSP